MFSVMAPPRHIAPSTTAPVSIAPVAPAPSPNSTVKAPETPAPAVAATDVIFVNGQAFNGRGYQVCGVANQRGRLCGRIGQCPFHAKKNATPKRPRSSAASSSGALNGTDLGNASSAAGSSANRGAIPDTRQAVSVRNAMHPTVRQMDIPPQKSRFKRSWTTDEHRRFLQAMRRHGKGKWKEIAVEVKTRTANQCQSHAQKYFLRQAKSDSERKKKSIHDVTEEDISRELHGSSMWPPNPLQALGQGPTQTAPSPAILSPTAPHPVLNTAPLPVHPVTSGVPLAPRRPSDESLAPSITIDASTPVTKVQPLPVSSAIPTPTSLSLAMPGDSESFVPWGASISSSSAPVSNSAGAAVVAAPSTSGATNSMSMMPSSSGVSTVPVVFPMTSLGLQYASMVPSFMNPSLGNSNSAAVVAPPPPPKLRVTVHVNGNLKGGMALMLPKTLEDFFQQAQTKLQFDGLFSRVFTRSGGEITCLDEMCQDDMLWLSTGEDFLTPR